MTDPVLVEVTRGALVESRHRGAVAIVDAGRRTVVAIGEVSQAVFPRSAVKPIQALVLVESGAAARFGFGHAEVALACASHHGEPLHVETARRMLAAAGRSEQDLECGVQVPTSREAAEALVKAGIAPGAIHNNCSGKHAGFICVAVHRGVPVTGYVQPGHPVQREVTAVLSELTGTALDGGVRAVDGCSIPTYAIPLDRLAYAFARFATGRGLSPERRQAARAVMDAMRAAPSMVAGTGGQATCILRAFGDRVLVKNGAEGVWCAAFPGLGLGVAVKLDDGAGRAAEVVIANIVNGLLDMDQARREAFAARLVPPVLSRNGAKVGEIRPAAALLDALRLR
jgi:L-asparaginase II